MIDYTIPSDLNALISPQNYALIIDLSLAYLRQNWKVSKVEDAIITAHQEEGKDIQFGLDNLIRTCLQTTPADWQEIVARHFSRFKENSAAYKFFFMDFEYAQKMLKTLVKPSNFGTPDLQAEMIKRIDFPDTYTFLVMDFDEQLRFLRKEDTKEWNVSESELFEIAQENVNKEEVRQGSVMLSEKFPLHTFFHSDFAVSYVIDFQQNGGVAVGPLGTLLAIPAKSAVFAHPITGTDFLGVMETIAPLVEKFFEGQPGSITTHFYWYYEGNFEVFPYEITKDNYAVVRLPEKLQSLLGD
jgi:hypothetical protein